MQIISIGSQLVCQPFSAYNSTYFTLSANHNYLEFIGLRFIAANVNSTSGYPFDYNFTLNSTINSSRRYYQAWTMCGKV